MLMRDFRIVGEEKFLPKNETRQLSLFTLQSIDLGKLREEAGARIEHSIVNADAAPDIGILATSRSFDDISGSIGASNAVADGWRLGLNGSHSEPAAQYTYHYTNGTENGTHQKNADEGETGQ